MGIETLIAVGLPLLWSTVGIALVAMVFRWLAAKINATKIGAASQWDELLMDWARTAVSNVGNKMADAVKADFAAGTLPAERRQELLSLARATALEQLRSLADAAGKRAELDVSLATGALDVIIRKAVDEREAEKKYEDKMHDEMRIAHDRREAAYAAEQAKIAAEEAGKQ